MPADVADALAVQLGDLPLALEQAAGYIETTATTPARYVALWRTERERLLGHGTVTDHLPLDATWSLSLMRLCQEAPSVQLA